MQALKAFKAQFKKEMIKTNELLVAYSRSSGPGGQNVNKVNTKVEIRFKIGESSFLPDQVKELLRKELSGRINRRDEFIVSSDTHRTQAENFQDCIEKMHNLIQSSIVIPGETSIETRKRIENLKSKFKNEMLISKKHNADKKSQRKGPRDF